MNKILEYLVKDLMMTGFCHDCVCTEMENVFEEKLRVMNEWIDEEYPDLDENICISKIIGDAFEARQEYMMACGIVIGLTLMSECRGLMRK